MELKNCIVNPVFITTHGQLRAACAEYKNIVKKYGEGSREAKAAFAKRRTIEMRWGMLKGVVKTENTTGALTEKDAGKRAQGYTNEVSSWYA